MVKVRIIGGLGNQMFQYAAAKALAIKNNTKVSANIGAFSSYDVHPLKLNKLNCHCTFNSTNTLFFNLLELPYIKNIVVKLCWLFNIYVEKEMPFNAGFFNLNKNASLVGYFQSEKYFLNIRELLLKEFQLREPLIGTEVKFEKEIMETDSVAIHIRRGDYISNQSANETHGICGKDYFINALAYMDRLNLLTKSTALFIFSDDIEWCRENLTFDYKTVFVDGSSERPEVDIHLMSKCKHQIISNSTFSWWGAWLNENPNKCVIAPLKWFQTLHDDKDIIPQSWKRL